VPDGRRAGLSDLVLRRWARLDEGRVVDSRGDPVAGARVRCRVPRLRDGDGARLRWREVRTDPSGRFAVHGREGARDGFATCVVTARGLVGTHRDAYGFRPLRRTEDGSAVLLEDPGTIEGRLRFDGRPPRWAMLSYRERDGYGDRCPVDARLSADGRRFRADGVPAGRYEFRLLAEDRALVELGEIEVGEGGSVDVGTIDLARGGTIEGVVNEHLDDTDFRSSVELVELRVEVDPDWRGRFRFDHVPEGVWHLRAESWRRGAPVLPVDVRAGETTRIPFNVNR